MPVALSEVPTAAPSSPARMPVTDSVSPSTSVSLPSTVPEALGTPGVTAPASRPSSTIPFASTSFAATGVSLPPVTVTVSVDVEVALPPSVTV